MPEYNAVEFDRFCGTIGQRRHKISVFVLHDLAIWSKIPRKTIGSRWDEKFLDGLKTII